MSESPSRCGDGRFPMLGTAFLLAVAAHGAQPDPLVRAYRPPWPASAVAYEDLDGDGDPDVLRATTVAGVPLQWIDDDDDMTATDVAGDLDSDCLMVDRNRDGQYGGPEDLIVDWNDENRDGRADLQVVAENAKLTDTASGPGHYMIVIDTDRDGVFHCLDWRDLQLKCWEHSGLAHFFEDYLGTSLFLKMHAQTASIRDLRYNWENPFLFYDEDDDGVSEKAIRLCDSWKTHQPPGDDFALPPDGRDVTNEMRRIEFTRKIDWASIAQDLDNDSAPGNEFDFDMTLHFRGPGFDYSDQVHPYRSLRGLPAADRFFYDPRWRQIDELIYPDHEAAWKLIFERGEWTRCWLVYDEDDDCHRWERVELYEPRDPFKIGVRQGGLDHHPQSDCSGDRGEWDEDNSGGGKLYVGRFDGRIHLFGAEWAGWRIDQDAHFFQGWSRSREQPERFATIRYSDTDANGFLDRIEYDLDGDRAFERAVALGTLGLDDRCELADPRAMQYRDFQELYRGVAENLWARAEAAVAVAEANGLDCAPYAGLRRPRSLREKYHYGYWLNHYIWADLANMAERRADAEFLRALDRAYFGGDWSWVRPLARRAAPPSIADATAGVRHVPVAEGWAQNAVNAVIFRQHAVTTHDDTQYVAFYDPQARMVLGRRRLGSAEWELHTTGHEGQVRDAHNAISIAVDGAGFLHVAWDHHGRPLRYARSVRPGALELAGPQPMTGQDEQQVTYPEFFNLADGGLLFLYRSGGSGRGNTMLNRYEPASGTWSVVQHPLIDGEGRRNAYTNQIAIDSAGTWHLSWCWRETGDVATNHDLCYARSADQGRTWTRSDGTAYRLPITAASAEIVCPIPQKQDLINQCTTAVDARGRPMIATYWRPEGSEVPQYHLVWHDGQAWRTVQIGQRTTPFTLSGGGTKRIPISRPRLAVDADDRVYMLFRDAERGSRVSIAVCGDPQRRDWRVTDLTADSVGFWEPSYDVQLWRRRGELHVFTQHVGQGDAETLDELPPQMISILEWRPRPAKPCGPWRFDFGTTPAADGYTPVDHESAYTAERGYGWVRPPAHLRDRGGEDLLHRDFVFSRAPATFRVDVPPGMYRITMIAGDRDYGDHVTRVTLAGVAAEPILLDPARAEFVTAALARNVSAAALEFGFDSPVNNWVLNALTIEPAEREAAPTLSRIRAPLSAEALDTWENVAAWPDPLAPHLARFRSHLEATPPCRPTGLTRADYLAVIAGNVDFFKAHQDEQGAIIDPHRGVEFQYATPCFGFAAAALVAHAGRADLLEPAARALDWAAQTLSRRQAASAHEDFFAPQIAHALPLLKPRVEADRAARWEEHIRGFDPYATYRAAPGGGNWNVVALSGEGLFCQLGLRPDREYVEACLAAQGRHFNSPWGLYTEGPLAYDHFPRLWAADLLATGFACRGCDALREVLRRGAATSLFMQSPAGELPAGGRSAHHQWNEAQQCVTFEIYAAHAAAAGDRVLAGVFKRAAHLALGSVMRWRRPGGELWIVKNRSDPAARHGYEGYSSHSQYNLLAMAMLAIAYEHAAATEDVPEQPAPADVGGFMLELPAPFHKVIANAGGLYVEIDTNADLAHNPTGLLRIHKSGCDPQLGPSDGLTAHAVYALPDGPRTTAAVGVAWQDGSGGWRRLAENGRLRGAAAGSVSPLTATLDEIEQDPQRVSFRLSYEGSLGGPARIVERYVVTPREVELTAEPAGYDGPVRLVWPVLVNDGARDLEVAAGEQRIAVTSALGTQTFEPVGAVALRLEAPRYAHRNGWARLAVAEFAGRRAALRIVPTARSAGE